MCFLYRLLAHISGNFRITLHSIGQREELNWQRLIDSIPTSWRIPWFHTFHCNNMKTIVHAVGAKDYFARTYYLVELPHENISTIADVCHSGVDSYFDYQFTCSACKEYTRATPRYLTHKLFGRIQLSVYDGSEQFFLMKICKRERYTRDAVQYQYSVLAMHHKKRGDKSSGIGEANKHERSRAAIECQSTLAEATNPGSVLANEVMDVRNISGLN
ncbi:hypothetical protein ACJIZ3_019800 [Penstemon smallii]|uniref:Uncharacterized protein n=1 Tax=Penstemon smallii TaxID=265156 RepID=A0ABD3T3F6_9LAMI